MISREAQAALPKVSIDRTAIGKLATTG